MAVIFESLVSPLMQPTQAGQGGGGGAAIGDHSNEDGINTDRSLSFNVESQQLEFRIDGVVHTLASSEDIGFYANIMTLAANNSTNIMQNDMRLDALETESSGT